MKISNKLSYEDALFSVNNIVVEKTINIGKCLVKTTIRLNGKLAALRLVNAKGTFYYSR